MNKGLLRFLIGIAITYGAWHWYNKNVLSKLNVQEQLADFERTYADDYDIDYDSNDDDDREKDDHYAYDDYDTGSDQE